MIKQKGITIASFKKMWSRGDSNPGPDRREELPSTCLVTYWVVGCKQAGNTPIITPYRFKMSL